MFQRLRGLFGATAQKGPPPAGRARIHADRRPARLYVIGDIHGCFAELIALERQIIADAAGVGGEKWIVTVGDYIDRGPASAAVVSHLMGPPPAGFRRFCLAGNHEQMLLEFLAHPRRDPTWLDNGGLDTARSYGLANPDPARPAAIAKHLEGLIPADHLDWMRDLPAAIVVPGFILVHAGIRPGVTIDEQSDRDLLWIREPFLDHAGTGGPIVVHGHTPVIEPTITASRIGIDTGAFATGRLTAVRIDEHGAAGFLSTGPGLIKN